MTFLEQKIRDAHTAGRTALIPFVTAGFPTLDTFWGIIEELDASVRPPNARTPTGRRSCCAWRTA